VLAKGADGGARVARPRLLRAAFGLRQAGVNPTVTLQALVSVLERLRSQADDMVRELAVCVLSAMPSADRAAGTTWEDLDQETIVFIQAITVILADAFHTVVERSGHQHLPDLIAEHSGVSFPAEATDAVDVG
jgi:hypothetical protein